MTKHNVEQIATIVEGLLLMNKRIVQTRENRIAFKPVDVNRNDPAYLTGVASELTNDAITHGFCSLASLKKSLMTATHTPDEGFQVERPNFIIGCFLYFKLGQCHLILFGK